MNRFKKTLCLGFLCFLGFHQTFLQAGTQTIRLTVEKIIHDGHKRLVKVKLTDKKTNKAITLNELKEVHTQKIHMLVIDDSLNDYSHVHPVKTKEAGVYEFIWQPKKQEGNYKIWADLVPLTTNQQEYVIANLYRSRNTLGKPLPEINTVSHVGGYKLKLAFKPTKLHPHEAIMGKVTIYDAQGKPIHNLEPLMGAFAHIVAFGDDFDTVIHVHPMGAEPTKADDRGGPAIEFHLEPQKAGFIKLFVQIKINGKELIAPFGLEVLPS